MSLGRSKIMISFAALGFIIGTAAYILFNWLFNQGFPTINLVPLADVFLSPWFLSGMAGAGIALIAIVVLAYYTD
jgi:hypothetical protein